MVSVAVSYTVGGGSNPLRCTNGLRDAGGEGRRTGLNAPTVQLHAQDPMAGSLAVNQARSRTGGSIPSLCTTAFTSVDPEYDRSE